MRVGVRIVLVLGFGVLLAGCGSSSTGAKVVVTTPDLSSAREPDGAPTYRVPSASMEPTLRVGQRVGLHSGLPRVGDIVVFHPPKSAPEELCASHEQVRPGGAACSVSGTIDASLRLVKRVVAGPGDTIKIVDGHAITNGRREADSYIRACRSVSECNFPVAIKVPAGEWYLLGDNRGESDDSRFWGPVPTPWIVGIVNPSATSQR